MLSCLLCGLAMGISASNYAIDPLSPETVAFDGIGAISGGGATSVYLRAYPEPARGQILDYLFRPGYGASLHMLKVEMGGDAQSTDGAETSYMHTPWVQDFESGYEWWLMAEAKLRNPRIKLYALPWAFPQWVSCTGGSLLNCSGDPFSQPLTTAQYVVGWIAGAKQVHGLDIDYVGCWNERPCDTGYVKTLRRALDQAGFSGTRIVVADGSWDVAQDVLEDPQLAASVYALGAHYPGTSSTADARATRKPLWASEDCSTLNSQIGAGCWVRILNRNFVDGAMTSTINWNLVAAYPKGTHWYRAGLFDALQPWASSYGQNLPGGVGWTLGPMLWGTAHTTQFSDPDSWRYLPLGSGSGLLSAGGSYVSLVDQKAGSLTVVVEKMSSTFSACVRPSLAPFDTQPELALFSLSNSSLSSLHLWQSCFASSSPQQPVYFQPQGTIPVVDGQFSLAINPDCVYTLTTLSSGSHPSPPPSSPVAPPSLFPQHHSDDFESCAISSEGAYFSDQNGAFQCVDSRDPLFGVVMQQMVPLRPITWSGDMRPFSLIGHRDLRNGSLACDASIASPSGSVMFGIHMQPASFSGDYSAYRGIIWGVNASGHWGLYTSIKEVASLPLLSGSLSAVSSGSWHRYRLDVNGTLVSVWVDGKPVISALSLKGLPTSGHGMIGTQQYGDSSMFDNFVLHSEYQQCLSSPVSGSPVSVVECSSEIPASPGSLWQFSAAPNSNVSSVVSLSSDPSLCLAVVPLADHILDWPLQLAPCNLSDPLQLFAWHFIGVSPDNEQPSWIYQPHSPSSPTPSLWSQVRCLDVPDPNANIGSPMTASICRPHRVYQSFWYDYPSQQIGNEGTATCMGVC
ncbi:MAG: hypothetical protein Q8P67_13485 [archaeon]|nr:hypothetical protein [archaeon]